MAQQRFTNNADTTLNGSLSNSATTLVVSASTGTKFPAPTAGDYFLATLYELNGSGVEINHEVVKVTARTSDTFTIVRAQDNTIARSYPDNVTNNPSQVVYVSLRWTAYAAENILYKDDNLNSLANKATARTNLGVAIGTDVQAYDANTVKKNVANSFSATQTPYRATATATAGASYNWTLTSGQVLELTFGAGNITSLTHSGGVAGTFYTLYLKQDGTGGRLISAYTGFKWADGIAPTLSTGANAIDIMTFYYDGTSMCCVGLVQAVA